MRVAKTKNARARPHQATRVTILPFDRLGEADTTICYGFHDAPFGRVLIATTPFGTCFIGFPSSRRDGIGTLHKRFPRVPLEEKPAATRHIAKALLAKKPSRPREIHLHVKGTPFQRDVWDALLRIPRGTLTTYAELAKAIKRPTALRAVGTAVGQNPIAVLIPCHRVVPANGALGGYHWGSGLKAALLAREGIALEQTKKPGVPGRVHLTPSKSGGGSAKGKR